jgi:hypothetical protein
MQCCDDDRCKSGVRNRYYPGKRLTPDALSAEQDYLIERRRLINRALHGWGVVYGYRVSEAPSTGQAAHSGALTVGPGLALDPWGRELLQVDPVELAFDDVIMLDDKGARIRRPRANCNEPSQWSNELAEGCWLLRIHYAERWLDERRLKDACSCERSEWDRICETVRYSIQRIDCDDCCADSHCDLECGCDAGECCRKHHEPHPPSCDAKSAKANPRNPVLRGACGCACHHVPEMPECKQLCEIDEACGRVRVDLRHGVPLACVRLLLDECKRPSFDRYVEDCGPRRVVKRSDLLFDLIRGCDLTRIAWMSWAGWYRSEISFEEFSDFFKVAETKKGMSTKFQIGFSRPVVTDTLKADCFAIAVMFLEKEGGWREFLRVPIVDVLTNDNGDGLSTEATLVVRTRWVKDAIFGSETRFDWVRRAKDDALPVAANVEIEIRGDYIVDCNGQTVDANAVGRDAAPTGNGTPGGTHLTTCKVCAREVTPDNTAY